jgi:hypothetical protein
MKDASIRALRTFIQSLIGAFLATSVLTSIASNSTIDADALQRAGISALAAAVIALLSFVQNALEEATGKNVLPK